MIRRTIAIAMLCVSTSGLARSPTAVDNRISIQVTQSERNQVLYEMREFLHSLFNMDNALAKNDVKSLSVLATPLAGLLERLPASITKKAPEEFIQLAQGMNDQVKIIAQDAETKADRDLALGQVADLMTYCSGCHDTFRFEVVPKR
jgi:cytochrome c556